MLISGACARSVAAGGRAPGADVREGGGRTVLTVSPDEAQTQALLEERDGPPQRVQVGVFRSSIPLQLCGTRHTGGGRRVTELPDTSEAGSQGLPVPTAPGARLQSPCRAPRVVGQQRALPLQPAPECSRRELVPEGSKRERHLKRLRPRLSGEKETGGGGGHGRPAWLTRTC